ncbi:MAG: J domain-containing protein [Rhodothalassiaceae bacterium]
MGRGKLDFGFPRWSGYGRETEAVKVRVCDAEGCTERADHPARKSPNSNEKWWFCERHAAEYNRNWDFFRGMSAEQAERFRREEAQSAHTQADPWRWEGPESDGLSRAERDAWAQLELEPGADAPAVKAQYRRLAKQYHPDRNPGDAEARARFHQIQAAYDFLSVRLSA